MPDRRDAIALASPLAGGTKIEWADRTFNPWWGCERVSPACAHCYADTLSKRYAKGKQLWGAGHDFRLFGDAHWDEPLKWARLDPAKLGRRPRVFCASMADVFEERLELEPLRERLFDLIIATPELDWLILTKRPAAARIYLDLGRQATPDEVDNGCELGWVPPYYYDGHARFGDREAPEAPLQNVWLGVSIENSRFTWRADVLREIPAAVRFVSAEPLLGSLFDPGPPMPTPEPAAWRTTRRRAPFDLTDIDWVIIGGESGPRARPFDIEHAREIIRRCDPYGPVCCGNQDDGECCGEPEPAGAREALPAVFVKQLGARPIRSYLVDGHPCSAPVFGIRDRKGGNPDEWPADLRIREHPRSAAA